MIIKFIAETDAERKRFGGRESVEHLNVKEYFIAGNKMDAEGSIIDFHEWNGAFRYLLGSLSYFKEVINDDRRRSLKQDEVELPSSMGSRKVIPMVKRGDVGQIQPLDISKLRVHTQNEPKDPNEVIEDEFVEDNAQSLRFQQPTEAQEVQAEEAEDGNEFIKPNVQFVAEELVDKLKQENPNIKNIKGLKITL